MAALGYFAYALLRARELADKLSKPTEQIDGIYDDVKKALLLYYDKEKGVFITKDGEISWHAQVWAILSGFLTESEGSALLEAAKRADPKIRMSSPFMIHYYLEALYSVKRSEEAEDYIKKYWGAMLEAGFDCCPECFDEKNDMLTPYNNIILNSACHAWGCTASILFYTKNLRAALKR